MSETEFVKNLFLKKSHWVHGYNAAVITYNGKMKVADDWSTFHPEIADGGSAFDVHRGLYNPNTQHLIILSTPDDAIARSESEKESWAEIAKQGEPHQDSRELWLDAAYEAEIPISGIDFLWMDASLGWDELYAAAHYGFKSGQYVLNPDPNTLGNPIQEALKPSAPAVPSEQLKLFSRLRDVLK